MRLPVGAVIHDPRLDPGVALPGPALGDEIVLQGIERADQRSGVAVGAQPHVDAENLPIGSDVAQGLDQFFAQTGEEVEILDAFLPFCCPSVSPSSGYTKM